MEHAVGHTANILSHLAYLMNELNIE